MKNLIISDNFQSNFSEHIGVAPEPPHICPARGPPLWDDWDAQMDEVVEGEPDWDLGSQPSPDCDVDQRVKLVTG